jgi:membrane protein
MRVSALARGLKRALADLEHARTFGLAAELSFWVFLALIPLAAMAELVTARLAAHHWGMVAPLMTSLPPAAAQLISSELAGVSAWNGGAVALPAALVFLWLASSGAHSVFDVLEIQTRSTRPWWKKRLLAMAVCLAFSVGAALLALLGAGLDGVEHLMSHAVPTGPVVSSAASVATRLAASALVVFALTAGLFRVGVPRDPKARPLPVLPGAALTTVLQGALGWGYGVYIKAVGTGGAYEGALAVIGVTMTMIYLLAIALLLGAELNRRLGERASESPPPHARTSPGSPATASPERAPESAR